MKELCLTVFLLSPERSFFVRLCLWLLLTLVTPAHALVQSVPKGAGSAASENLPYLIQRLANGVELVIHSNPSLTTTQAIFNLRVGSLNDPQNLPGLAHLFEHLILRSTINHEDPSVSPQSLRQWTQSQGGRQNAVTHYDQTQFRFTIPPSALEPALTYWVAALSQPALTTRQILDELAVLDQEFALRKRDRRWQERDALKALAPSDHPFQHWHPGSEESLLAHGESALLEGIKQFHQRYYQAHNLRVIIRGPQPAALLRDQATPILSALAVEKQKPTYVPPMLSSQNLPAQLVIQGRRDDVLTLLFPSPGNLQIYNKNTAEHLAHLLQSNHRQGLLDTLRRQGLIQDLRAGQGMSLYQQNSFHISLKLTPLGRRQQKQVISTIFQYVTRIEEKGLVTWRLREFVARQQLKLALDSAPGGDQMDLSTMTEQPLLSFNSCTFDYQLPDCFNVSEVRASITGMLADLTPDNLLLIRLSRKLEAAQESPVFATRYQVLTQPITATPLEDFSIADEMQLPPPNPLIPAHWQTYDKPFKESVPQRLWHQDGISLWAAFDAEAIIPTAEIRLLLSQPQASSSLENTVLTELFLTSAKQSLKSYQQTLKDSFYSASLQRKRQGIYLSVHGYSAQLPNIVDKLLTVLQTHRPEPNEFNELKARLRQRWLNQDKYDFEQLYDRLYAEVLPHYWVADDKINQLDSIEYRQLSRHSETLFPVQNATVFYFGNGASLNAKANIARLKTLIAPASEKSPPKAMMRNRIINAGKPLTVATRGHDNAFVYYHQAENDDPLTTHTVKVLQRMLHKEYFQRLRTEEKLGYAVFVAPIQLPFGNGLALTAQSPTTSVTQLEESTQRFLSDFADYLDKLNQRDFSRLKQSALQQLQWQHLPERQKADALWKNILDNSLPRDPLIDDTSLAELSLERLRRYYHTQFLSDNGNTIVLRSLHNGNSDTTSFGHP